MINFVLGSSASDTCGPVNLTQIPEINSIVTMGTTDVTIIAMDEDGNVDECTTSIILEDKMVPTINFPNPFVINMTDSCTAVIPNINDMNIVTDNCQLNSVSQFPLQNTIIDSTGVYYINVTAIDASGNEINQITPVTYLDVTIPVISECASSVTLNVNEMCQVMIPEMKVSVNATDSCSSVVISQNPLENTLISLGSHTVTFSIVDTSGMLSIFCCYVYNLI